MPLGKIISNCVKGKIFANNIWEYLKTRDTTQIGTNSSFSKWWMILTRFSWTTNWKFMCKLTWKLKVQVIIDLFLNLTIKIKFNWIFVTNLTVLWNWKILTKSNYIFLVIKRREEKTVVFKILHLVETNEWLCLLVGGKTI